MTTQIMNDTKIETYPTGNGGQFYKIDWAKLTPKGREFAVKSSESIDCTDCGIVGATALLTDSTLTGQELGGLVLSADLLIEVISAKKGKDYRFSLDDIKTYINEFGKDKVEPWVQSANASIRDFAVLGAGRRNMGDGQKYCGQISILFAAIARAMDEGNSGVMQYLLNELGANPNQRLYAYANNASGLQGYFEPCLVPESPGFPVDVPLLYCLYLAANGACQKRVLSSLRVLMYSNADPNQPNMFGVTPYAESLRRGYKFALDEFSCIAPELDGIVKPNRQAFRNARVLAEQTMQQPEPTPGLQSILEYVLRSAPQSSIQFLYDQGCLTAAQKQMAVDVTKDRLMNMRGKSLAMIMDDARIAAVCARGQFVDAEQCRPALTTISNMTTPLRALVGAELMRVM